MTNIYLEKYVILIKSLEYFSFLYGIYPQKFPMSSHFGYQGLNFTACSMMELVKINL